jgi:TonB-linked SusC/RagA family outer membrane protein
MSEESNILEDAVVVGFGKQKKESMVGSVTAISPGELKTTSSNLSTAFAGRIAGVVTVQSSGEPGADGSNFWIRGISTFGNNTKPLIILDGVEIDSSVLDMISPESIEQFSVLKDATSTALYGSKGANGVLIVTTKEGKSNEKIMVNVRVENGWTMPSRMTPIADGVTYMEKYNEARRNDNLTDYYSEEKILGTRLGINPYVFPNNDWYSMMFKDFSYNQTANVNLRGGGKRINYFLNACINHENGIIKNNDVANFDVDESIMKYQFQSNVSAQVTNTTKVALKMTTQISDRYKPVTSPNTLFLYTMQSNPVSFPAYFPAQEGDTHVRYGSAPSWGTGDVLTNPLAFLNLGYYTIGLTTQLTTVNIDQDFDFITKGLKASFMASFKSYQDRTTTNHLTSYYYRLADYWVNPDGTYSYNTTQVGADGSEVPSRVGCGTGSVPGTG